MRKLIFFLLGFLIFCLFAILGYLSAFHEQNNEQPGVTLDAAIPTPSQNNFLIIQTDHIDSPTARLEAVWAVYYFKSTNQTVLTFSEVFPSADPNSHQDDLANTFSINQDGNPGGTFFQKIGAKGGPWRDYLMIDEQGSLKIREWLEGSGIPVQSDNPYDSMPILQGICQSIDANSKIPTKFLIDWSALAPFIKTNLQAKRIVDSWGEINSILRPAHCKILPQSPP